MDGIGVSRSPWWITVALAAIVLWAHAPGARNGFTTFDDDTYVVDNEHVRDGLSPEGIAWALTTTHAANWHPLTWLSHMVDAEVFGPSPAGHHAVSIALHVLVTLLLFHVLRLATGSLVRSALVGALFGVHPLGVESVAWVAERKTVLAGVFWWLTTWAYLYWAARPGPSRYALLVVTFLLGLASKPLLVTLPFALVLLDFWPLRRLSGELRRRLVEKGPLLALAAASCIVTWTAQRAGGAVKTLEQYPLDARLGNAVVSYTAYLTKILWPSHLAAFYPHPGAALPVSTIAAAAAFLAAITAVAWGLRERAPYVLFGWLWFVGTLVPMVGVVQVGSQSMADRYTYVSMVGVLVAIVWGAAAAARAWPGSRGWVLLAAFAAIVVLAGVTRAQTGHWRNNVSVWEHAIEVTRDNATAHANLALEFSRQDRLDEARVQLTAAVRIRPGDADLHNNLGNVLAREGRFIEAVASFDRALRLRPNYGLARANRAGALMLVGRTAEAREDVRRARELGVEPPRRLLDDLERAGTGSSAPPP